MKPADAKTGAETPRASGVELIAAERRRQIAEEGWTPERDDQYTNRELQEAALSYAMGSADFWPWSLDWWKPSTDHVRNLVKAGALIAAEIDRLERNKR